MAKSNVSKKPISEEEYTTNKVLTVFSVCLLGVLVLMFVQRQMDYASTWRIGMMTVRALLGLGIVGVLWGLWLLVSERTGKRTAARRIVCGRHVLIVSIVLIACMTAVYYLGTQPIKGLYVVLPALAVYYLVYHSYAPEFFLIAVDAGVAAGLIWVAHRAALSASYGSMAYAALGAAVVLAIAQIACVYGLRGKKGVLQRSGKTVDLHLSRNAYRMLTVTPVVMAVLVAVAVLMPTAALAAMGIAAAYLFITAVYYTVKLM